MSLTEHGWINVFRGILDVIVAAILTGFVIAVLPVRVPEAAPGPLLDSRLILPGIVISQTSAMSIDRTLKSDRRLSLLLIRQNSIPLPSSEIAPTSSKRIPLGCDPAFSSIADPAQAHVYKRCIA